jgi:CO/xanthine dehydrogenase Mo-binding subunit
MERRSFLQLGATAAGGLILGFHLPEGRAAGLPEGPTQLNAWIRIDTDNRITFICPRNEMGQDVHTALAVLLAEELEVPVASLVIEQAPVAPAYTNRLLGAQMTGGSTSIRDAWQPLRQAGATVRTLMLNAAAKTWQVDVGRLQARNGYVHNTNGNKLSYGWLAAMASTLKVGLPENVSLKSPAAFTQIGSQTQKRLDTFAKVRGERLFGIDARQPGMLYAALAQCPVIGGKVAGVDASAARAMAGVRDVVDIGEGVAVVADRFWTARAARDALKITWDRGPGAALSDASVAAALKAGTKEQAAVARSNGDVEGALARSAKRLEAEYDLPLLAHVALEPMNCLARVSDEGCDIWASTQFPEGARTAAAARAGVDPQRVQIHAQFIGGGFGRRLEADFVGQAAAIAKAFPGVPVKLMWTREDDTTHDFYRPPSLHLLRGGLDAKGKLLALDHLMVSPSVSARAIPDVVRNGLDPFMTEGIDNLVYAVPNLRARVVIKDTGVRVGYWRSVSHALNAFAIESFVDELALAARRDPLAFRLELLAEQPRQRAVLEKVVEMSGWKRPRAAGTALGLASMECYGTYVALVAEVARRGKGVRCTRIAVAVDPGIVVRPDQVVAQVESAVITGLMGALRNRISIVDGEVQQTNFDQFQPLRMSETPTIDVAILASGDAPGGMGEVGTPLVAPALANAVAKLTGKRVRKLPFSEAGVEFG